MTWASGQALGAALLGAAAFCYVASRSSRSEIRNPLLAVLGFLVLWMLGRGILDVAPDASARRLAFHVRFLGACGLGPSFVLLAARFTRSRLPATAPGLFVFAWVPPALCFMALMTNDGHRLYARSLEVATRGAPPVDWAGPFFWANLAWQLMLVTAGVALFARYAATVVSRAQRFHAQALVLASAIPVVATLAHYFDLVPLGFNPIPLASIAAVAAILGIIIRYRLLDLLPLARRDVIDAISDAVILADADGAILDLNRAAVRLLGEPASELREQPMCRALARLAVDPDVAALERSLEDAIRSDAPVGVPLRTRSGTELEIRADTVRDGDDRPSGRFAIVRDVTGMRRYERLLRESQQRVIVGGMAASLAHEVNNPLAFVASNLQQIHRVATFDPAELEPFPKQRASELSELAEVVAETIEGVERIARIVGRIIRPGSAHGDDLIPLDPIGVIRDAVRLVEFNGQYPVRIRVELPDGLPAVEGSPERLSQALLNLVLNAQQVATGLPDAAVLVDARQEPSGVSVRIGLRTTGGDPIPGETPAVASEGGATVEAELSATYDIVQQHGGTLEPGSEHGSLFTLRLPAAA